MLLQYFEMAAGFQIPDADAVILTGGNEPLALGVDRDPDTVRLTCVSHGPDPIDSDLERRVDELLAGPSGWLIYNTHGLDGEGWGPLSSEGLTRLLARLVAIPSVRILPAGRALNLTP